MDRIIGFIKENIFLSISILIIIVLGGLSGYLYYLYSTTDIIECPKCEENTEVVKKIYVDVKGSVKNPGVYEVTNDNIVNDVINMAGGFKSNAYKNNINLSKKVSDELVINVFSKYEYSLLNKDKDEKKIDECTSSTYNIDNCKESSIIISGKKDTVTSNNDSTSSSESSNNNDNSKQIVNINTASISELTTLPGLGEKKAENVIKYREEHGNFEKIEDILNVSGIGDSLYESIKDLITV